MIQRSLRLLLIVWVFGPGRSTAQDHAAPAVKPYPRVTAIPLLMAADPVPDNGQLTEFRVVQPTLGGDVAFWQGVVIFTATIDFEGTTIPSGELALGNWGEGFIDRRHPHTYAHELMTAVRSPLSGGGWQAGMAFGKGFATYGTDDPMSRPPIRFPVNHHWSQILERAVVLGQLRYRILTLEGSLFNGDEPENPSQWPNLDRFGDSWAVRGTVAPWQGVEAQLSRAVVISPEHRPGAGLEHQQWSASVRLDRPIARRPVYALVEWAQVDVGPGAFKFQSFLAEGAIRLGRVRPYYRFERTERPEEERISAFRSRRPPLDNSILGSSRWTTHTGGLTAELVSRGKLSVAPVIEATFGRIEKVGGGLFSVADWYETPDLWSVSLGLRLRFGMGDHRMGRYGVLRRDVDAHAAGHGA